MKNICKYVKNELYKILHPNAVLTVKIDDKVVNPEVVKQTIFFVFAYFGILMISSIIIMIIEQNIVLGITSSVSLLGCIGPGFGSQIGPLGSFSELKILSKIILIMNMLIGRLEIIPFLVMFHFDFLIIIYFFLYIPFFLFSYYLNFFLNLYN